MSNGGSLRMMTASKSASLISSAGDGWLHQAWPWLSAPSINSIPAARILTTPCSIYMSPIMAALKRCPFTTNARIIATEESLYAFKSGSGSITNNTCIEHLRGLRGEALARLRNTGCESGSRVALFGRDRFLARSQNHHHLPALQLVHGPDLAQFDEIIAYALQHAQAQFLLCPFSAGDLARPIRL